METEQSDLLIIHFKYIFDSFIFYLITGSDFADDVSSLHATQYSEIVPVISSANHCYFLRLRHLGQQP